MLDVKQLAARLNISERQVRDLVYKRRIPYVKVGRLLRFNTADIAKWAASNRTVPREGDWREFASVDEAITWLESDDD